jgi:CDP-diacylglycerol--glycerol-3-phosphate 3-phosphatidyltransferase
VNLPNTLTVARIIVTPLIAWLPFVADWRMRLLAFVLFIAAAVTDYWDGHLARTRGLITDLGKQLDPLADKLLLLGTFVPMYLLQAPAGSPLHHYGPAQKGVPVPGAVGMPFLLGDFHVYLPLVVILVILGRETAMTAFRSAAARKGVVIAAIGSAKLKTVLQQVWVGTAYFWFWAATAAHTFGIWDQPLWRAFTWLNGIVGTLSMTGAVVLTLWSMWLYVRRYGMVLVGRTKA